MVNADFCLHLYIVVSVIALRVKNTAIIAAGGLFLNCFTVSEEVFAQED